MTTSLTVEELIKTLQTFDPKAQVVVTLHSDPYAITKVERHLQHGVPVIVANYVWFPPPR